MALYQLLIRDAPQCGQVERPKWQFVAHGARYTSEEADAYAALIAGKGRQLKRIRI